MIIEYMWNISYFSSHILVFCYYLWKEQQNLWKILGHYPFTSTNENYLALSLSKHKYYTLNQVIKNKLMNSYGILIISLNHRHYHTFIKLLNVPIK